jgi:hypothetical protein
MATESQVTIPDNPRKRGGRRSALDDQNARERFLDHIRGHNRRRTSAIAVGWSPDSVENWIRRGRGLDEDLPPTKRYTDFVRDLERAEAEGQIAAVGYLVRQAPKDPRAALKLLEKRYAEDWGADAPPETALLTDGTSITNQTFVYVDQRTLGEAAERLLDARVVSERETVTISDAELDALEQGAHDDDGDSDPAEA